MEWKKLQKSSEPFVLLFLLFFSHFFALGGSVNEDFPMGGWVDPLHKEYLPHILLPTEENGEKIPLCRHKTYMPQPLYTLDTCAWCYRYVRKLPATFGIPSRKANFTFAKWRIGTYTYHVGVLKSNGTLVLANSSDAESPLLDTFDSDVALRKWHECCEAAESCCQKQVRENMAALTVNETGDVVARFPDGERCPSTWDGWQCWSATKAGVTATSHCPDYIYFLTEPPSCSIPLEKDCTITGRWYRRNVTLDEWTNYEPCGTATVSLQLRRAYVLISAYALSIIAIIPALCIFFAYKQLRVHRIILHQNLLLSMLMNGIFVILFKSIVMLNEIQHTGNSLIEQNSVGCRILLILTKYSRMTNYLWMFCEGFYLHKLIAAAFAEQKSLLVFYLMGWVFPILPCVVYSVYRQGWANGDCWVMPEEGWDWVLNGPSLLSLVINACFLINIIRVLVTKLRATHTQEPSQYRKAVRATLVLLPLFGLHFLVTIYRPPTSTGVCLWTEIYFYANDILDGIQGFLVALIFCYFNGEVSSLLKRTWMRIKDDYTGQRSSMRNKRQGSLGRSVVTTQVYSSVPPSPDTNCLALADMDGASMSMSSTNATSGAKHLLAVNGNNKPVNLLVTTKNGAESSCV